MPLALDRRTLLHRALVLAGASILPSSIDALATAAKSEMPQLDALHFATLTELADTLIPKTDTPGAIEAGVPKLVDALLGSWASVARRTEMIGALDAIDIASKAKYQRVFAKLTPAERAAFLESYDAAALTPLSSLPARATPAGAGPLPIDPAPAVNKPAAAESSPLFDGPHFTDPGYAKLKEIIVVGFYASEIALQTELSYEHAPGKWIPSMPITPKTRASGGLGLF